MIQIYPNQWFTFPAGICVGGQNGKMGPTERPFKGRIHGFTDWNQLRKFELMDQAFQKIQMLPGLGCFLLSSRLGLQNSPLQRGSHPQPRFPRDQRPNNKSMKTQY